MSLAALLNRPCTITHMAESGVSDEYGNPTPDTTVVDSVCYAEQRRASEDTVLTDVQSQDWLVMLPADAVVTGNDRIAVGDLVLELQGPPWPVRNPRLQIVSHVECIARQVT